MALGHHHHHHHHHEHDAHDVPLDAANQSLADALRASFGILKVVMFVLVVMYCFSGVNCVEENEQAVIMRFGKLLPEIREPGLSIAFPYPIDETIALPTKKDNKFLIKSQWPSVRASEEAEPLNKVRGAGELNPGIDGALLTADRGMVHMQWQVIYRITNLRKFVLRIPHRTIEDAERLITPLVENAAIDVVSRYSAEAVTRGMTTQVAREVENEVNQRLEALDTGISIVAVDAPRSSVPGQTLDAFDDVTKAENQKEKAIREAEQKRSDLLNRMAGEAYEDLLNLLDERDLAIAQNKAGEVRRLSEEIDALVENRAGGRAGQAIRRAKGFYTNVVQDVRGDVDEYRAALDEYLTQPELFIHRMWEDTRMEVLQRAGVIKHYLPKQADELRIIVAPDPLQREIEERRRLQQEAEEYDFSAAKRLQAIPPSGE